MTRRTRPRQSLFAGSRIAVGLALLGCIASACGGTKEQGALGANCFRADDCSYGLACIEGQCSNDLTLIETTVMGPMAAAGGAPGDAGAPVPSGGTAAGGAAGASAGTAGAAGDSAGGDASGGAAAGGDTSGGASGGGAGGSTAGTGGMGAGGSGGTPSPPDAGTPVGDAG